MTNTALRDRLAGMMVKKLSNDPKIAGVYAPITSKCAEAIEPAVAELIEAATALRKLTAFELRENKAREPWHSALTRIEAALSTFQARASEDGEG